MKIINLFKEFIHRLKPKRYKHWLPGEPPPPPLTQEMMDKAYRTLVDNGVIKYGEKIWVETRQEGKE